MSTPRFSIQQAAWFIILASLVLWAILGAVAAAKPKVPVKHEPSQRMCATAPWDPRPTFILCSELWAGVGVPL